MFPPHYNLVHIPSSPTSLSSSSQGILDLSPKEWRMLGSKCLYSYLLKVILPGIRSKGWERESIGRTAGRKVVMELTVPQRSLLTACQVSLSERTEDVLGGPAEFVPGQANLFPSALVAHGKASLLSLENCQSFCSTKSSLQTQGKPTASDCLTGVSKDHPFPLSRCRESHGAWPKLVSDWDKSCLSLLPS